MIIDLENWKVTMLWDDMTEIEKLTCYQTYVENFKNKSGDKAIPMPFDEYDKEWTGRVYEIL